jgi:hypothetical protein
MLLFAALRVYKPIWIVEYWGEVPNLFLENNMSFTQRVLLSIGILLIDLIVFFLPLTALFLAYIILANPIWFREFLQDLNQT